MKDNINIYGWYFLIAAIIGDVLVSWLFSLFYEDYSNLKMSISALGNPQSPVRLPFNIWMFTEGILFLLALPALYKYYHPVAGRITNIMIAFIAFFAIGACIFTSFFSVNESKEIVTIASKIHGVGSVLGFILFLFVPLLVAILSFNNRENIIGYVSILCFVVAIIFFILFIMADKERFSNTIVDNEGLWQRLNLIFMYAPLVIVAVRRILEA